MKKNNNSKKILLLVGIALLVIIAIGGVSYAFFESTISKRVNEVATPNNLTLGYTDDTSYMLSGMIPATPENAIIGAANMAGTGICKDTNSQTVCSLYEFTVDNPISLTQKIKIFLNPKVNTFTNLEYMVIKGDNESITATKTPVIYSSSLTKDSTANIELTGLKNTLLGIDGDVKDSVTYTIIFYIKNQTYNQSSEDSGKTFSGGVMVNSITTGSYVSGNFGTDCWTIEDTTLTAFYGINSDRTIKQECTGYVTADANNFYDITVPVSFGGVLVTNVGNQLFNALIGINQETGKFQLNNYQYIKHIGFEDGSAITTIDDAVTTLLTGGTDLYGTFIGTGYSATNGVVIDLPNSLTKIGYASFLNSGLRSITIPANVTDVGAYAFAAMGSDSSLREVTFLGTSANADLYIKQAAFSCGVNICALDTLVLPGNLVEIGEMAFEDNTNLQTVNFPSHLKIIKKEAFTRTKDLQKIYFPEDSELETIEYGAFRHCNLNYTINNDADKLFIPASVTSIGQYAFYNENAGTGDNTNLLYIIYGGTSSVSDDFSENWYNSALTTLSFK